MSTLKNGEFGIDLDKEKILWTDRKRHTIFSLPLSFTKYTLTETKLIIQRGCFNLREDEIQLYRVRDIAFKQNFYERLVPGRQYPSLFHGCHDTGNRYPSHQEPA